MILFYYVILYVSNYILSIPSYAIFYHIKYHIKSDFITLYQIILYEIFEFKKLMI